MHFWVKTILKKCLSWNYLTGNLCCYYTMRYWYCILICFQWKHTNDGKNDIKKREESARRKWSLLKVCSQTRLPLRPFNPISASISGWVFPAVMDMARLLLSLLENHQWHQITNIHDNRANSVRCCRLLDEAERPREKSQYIDHWVQIVVSRGLPIEKIILFHLMKNSCSNFYTF